MSTRSPAVPRVLVFVPDSGRSTRATGWLEKNAVGTLRCWTLSSVRTALKDAGPLLGAALIDSLSSDAPAVQALIASSLPDLPMLLWETSAGQDHYSFARPTNDAFGIHVRTVLMARSKSP